MRDFQAIADDGAAPNLGHRPALDGLRGFAILVVVVSNFRWGILRGGFLGVDVFFVLSGFLITSLLLGEHARRRSIHLGRFYGRRALRLLPALVALLCAMLAYALVAGSAPVRHQTLVSSAYALFYVGNWYMALGGEAALKTMGPLAPTWSLSVEEQFYLVWPVVLVALLAARISLRRLALFVGVAAICAAGWRSWLWFHDADWRRLYFGADTRGDSLLVGCALGLLFMSGAFARVPERITRALAIAGLAILCVLLAVAPQNSGFMYAGGGYTLAAVSAGAVLVHVVRAPESGLAKVFSMRWLAWVGAVSYGIYLWHGAIGTVIEPSELSDLPRFVVELLRVAATMLAVVVSYYVIERPFLKLKRRLAYG